MPPPRPLAAVRRSGFDSDVVVVEPGAGPPNAGLDLVEPQQGTLVGRDSPRLGQVALRGDNDARLTLNGLQDDGCRLVVDSLGQREASP